MKSYKMIMLTNSTGLPWEYNFQMVSNETAIEYTKKIISQPDNIPASFMSIVLWAEEDADRNFLGEWTVKTVRNIVEIPL